MLIKRADFWLVVAALIIVISLFTSDKSMNFFLSEIEESVSQKMETLFSSDKKTPVNSKVSSNKEKDPSTSWFAKIFGNKNSKNTVTNSKEKKINESSENSLQTTPGTLAEVIREFKKKNGDSLVVYRSLIIYPDRIHFSRRDPKMPENVDRYSWTKSKGWQEPKPEKTPSESDLKRYLADMNSVNFEQIPALVEVGLVEMKKRGLEDAKIDYISLSRKDYRGDSREPSIYISFKGQRKDGFVEFDQNGVLLKAKLN